MEYIRENDVQVVLNIISAQDLIKTRFVGKVHAYAIAWIQTHTRITTHVDMEGDINPTWNTTMTFLVDKHLLHDERSTIISIQIFNNGRMKDTLLGTIGIVLSNIYDRGKSRGGIQYCALQIRRPSGRAQGILNIGSMILEDDDRILLLPRTSKEEFDNNYSDDSQTSSPHPRQPNVLDLEPSIEDEQQESSKTQYEITERQSNIQDENVEFSPHLFKGENSQSHIQDEIKELSPHLINGENPQSNSEDEIKERTPCFIKGENPQSHIQDEIEELTPHFIKAENRQSHIQDEIKELNPHLIKCEHSLSNIQDEIKELSPHLIKGNHPQSHIQYEIKELSAHSIKGNPSTILHPIRDQGTFLTFDQR